MPQRYYEYLKGVLKSKKLKLFLKYKHNLKFGSMIFSPKFNFVCVLNESNFIQVLAV